MAAPTLTRFMAGKRYIILTTVEEPAMFFVLDTHISICIDYFETLEGAEKLADDLEGTREA